jgi:hypothetical protein
MHYDANAYKVLFPAEAAPGIHTLEPAEDGYHHQEGRDSFEWWYFDVKLDDGGWLVIVFHSALFNLGDHIPTLDMRYYPPQAPPIIQFTRYPQGDCSFSEHQCAVQMGTSRIETTEGEYHIQAEAGSLRVDLTLKPLLAPIKIGSGHLFAAPECGHVFNWVIPLLKAQAEGELHVAGQCRRISGLGYHDHNWGNFYLPLAFQGWTWGRVWSEEDTLVFGDVVGRGIPEPRVRPLILAQKGKPAQAQKELRLQKLGSPATFRLEAALSETPCSLTVTSTRLLDAVTFPALRPLWAGRLRLQAERLFYATMGLPGIGRIVGALLGRTTYLRREVSGALALGAKIAPVQGVVEEMRFRRRLSP